MNTAGYSGKSLINKLGYTAGDSVQVYNGPQWFVEYLTQEGILNISTLPTTWAHLFVTTQQDLARSLSQTALKNIKKALWISWPKKTSGVETDITEQTLRDVILPLGWVDTKVVAVDEIWSGLKFMRRKR